MYSSDGTLFHVNLISKSSKYVTGNSNLVQKGGINFVTLNKSTKIC